MFAEYPYPFMTADAKKAATRTYDYIVVGGGAAGCPLAATLSQKYSVLLLERGDSPYGNPDVEEFEKIYRLFGDATDFPYVAEAFYSEDGVQLARGRVLGGGTAINGGFYSRARSEDIQEMKWDEKLVNESYEWVEKSIIFKQYKLFPWNSAFKNGLLQVGVLPYNGYTLDHLEGTKISGSIFDKNGKRHSAADLLQHANPENIVVLLNATASRILFTSVSGKLKASGVEFKSNDGVLPYQVSLNQLSTNSEFAFTNNKHMKTLQYIGTSLPNNPLNNSALAKYCNDTLDTYNHYHGGCQVGLVVDRRYQVKGVDNLRVVDGSIFKDSLGTNPQATILMLGRYMGIQILQERNNP
ncbi:hypothetical protein SUGI_0714060 [Cryptomeria japonica]|nr:hypothetical protein SUGI_0714060 [Cryptomeria japonica]